MRRVVAALLAAVLLSWFPLAGADTSPPSDETHLGEVIGFRVKGRGWGHGVGISQWGLRNRALAGQSTAAMLRFYYPGTSLGTDASPVGLVRIRVARSVRAVHIRPTSKAAVFSRGTRIVLLREPFTISRQAGAYRVETDAGRVFCEGQDPATTCGPALWVRYPPGEDITVTSETGTHSYRWGRLRLLRQAGLRGFQVLNGGVALERYLLGLAEVPASWPPPALRAQAIAGRSYASATVRSRRGTPAWAFPWDLEANTLDQVYVGSDLLRQPAAAPWIAAVRATRGVVVRGVSGDAVTTNYSSSNGGYTESSSYVWRAPAPWLVAQPDPFDAPNPNAGWSRDYTRAEIRRWLVAAGHPDPGPIERIVVTGDIGASSRIDHADVVIRGRSRRVVIDGRDLRSMINAGLATADDTPARTVRSTRLRIGPIRAARPGGTGQETGPSG